MELGQSAGILRAKLNVEAYPEQDDLAKYPLVLTT